MEIVKEGYKQTEVGIIPEEWIACELGDVLKIRHGKGQKEVEDKNGDYPILGTGGLMGYANKFLYNKESVLIGRKGTIDKPRYMETPFWTVDTLFYSEIKPNAIAKYLYYNFLLIDWYSHNEASGVPSLNASKIEKIFIPLPPTLTEQKAIATALSDVDELINNLDKLITKKKAIKQGAMQELLTGKKRLAGFDGEWAEKKLGDISKINMGQSPLSSYYNDDGVGLPLVQGNADIKNRKTIIRNYTSQITKTADAGDIIMSVRAPVGEVAVARFNCCIGRGVCSIKYPNDFLYHYLIYFEPSWGKFSTGSTFDSINSNQLRDMNISIPNSSDEQKTIAQILSDMDIEIEQLANRRTKYQNIKQGMMQELLTGKTRLV